jgi:hypothetical protein
MIRAPQAEKSHVHVRITALGPNADRLEDGSAACPNQRLAGSPSWPTE